MLLMKMSSISWKQSKMQSRNNSTKAFLELVRAGLWEKEARLLPFNRVDYNEVMHLAEEQSVVGLVAAGIDYVADVKVPQADVLQFVGSALQLEQRNLAMINFVVVIVEKLRKSGIRALLVKGPAVAQCYERPLWRACGDIDLFISKDDHDDAVNYLLPFSTEKVQDSRFTKSTGLLIDGWFVEVHGTLRCGLSSKLVRETDAVQQEVFYNSDIRIWRNRDTDVLLPGVNSDLFLLFTHFVRHFYKEGVVIRQLCDWCRFLWNYREEVDVDLLLERLRRTELLDEWRAFAALTVDYLGMPVKAMPLYSDEKRWHKKGDWILNFIMKGCVRKKARGVLEIARIFPVNTLKFLPSILFHLNWLKVKEIVFAYLKGKSE